jgi:hypothetical protein
MVLIHHRPVSVANGRIMSMVWLFVSGVHLNLSSKLAPQITDHISSAFFRNRVSPILIINLFK